MTVQTVDDVTPNSGDDDSADERIRVVEDGLESTTPWRLAESLVQLRKQIDQLAPQRSKKSDGAIGDTAHATRSSDHNPWILDGKVGVVTAIDVTDHPNGGLSADAVAESLRSARDARVKYIIWNGKIASSQSIDGAPAWSWRSYAGKNSHKHHLHLSVGSDKAHYDNAAAWKIEVS